MTDDLQQRRIVPIGDAADVLGISIQRLTKKLAEHSLPIFEFGPRNRGVRLADIDTIARASERQLERAS